MAAKLLAPGPVAAPSSVATPLTIAGASLLRWAEIGAGSETVVGGVVTTFSDLSGNGYHGTAAASQEPFYEAGGWNGQPSMAFDGGNDFFTIVAAYATALAGGNDKSFTVWFGVQFFITTDNVAFSCGNSVGTTPLFDYFASTTSGKFRMAKNDGVAKNVDTIAASNKLRHVAKCKIYGTTAEIYIDGVLASAAAVNFDAASVTFNKATDGCLGRSTNSLFFNGRMTAHVGVAGNLAADDEAAMDAYMAKFLATPTAPMLLINGDSLSMSNKWPVDFAAGFPAATIVNTSVGGQTLFGYGVPNIARDGWSNYDAGRSANLISIQFGANDIVNARTGAQIYANYQTAVTALKTNNPARKVLVATLHQRTALSGAEETARTDFNTLIRGDKAGADYLLDRDLIITEAPSDTNIYADGVHLTDLGDTYIYAGRNGQTGMSGFAVLAGF